MPKIFNRVAVATATTGTGTVTFGSALDTDLLTPSEAGAVDSDEVWYLLEEGGDFEIGVGTIGGSETTLSRDAVIASKIGGTVGTSKMDLQGSATLRFVEPSEAWRADSLPLVSPVRGEEDVQAALEALASGDGSVSTLANLISHDAGLPGDIIYMKGRLAPGDKGFGLFMWDGSDLSTEVSVDTLQGVYVAPSSDSTGASGAWVRRLEGGKLTPYMFGAVGDLSADDTDAINAAFDLIRSTNFSSIEATKYYLDGLLGAYRVDGSLNLTKITHRKNWSVRNMSVQAYCTGKAVFDLTGSRHGQFMDIFVWGVNGNEPASGFQLAREDNGLGGNNPCDSHYFSRVFMDGYYSMAALHVCGAEACDFHNVRAWNRKSNGVNDLALILDGSSTNRPPVSDFTTPLTNSRSSFTVNNFLHCKFQKPFGITGPTCFFRDLANHNFVNCYVTNGGGPIINWQVTSGFTPYQINMDMQIETEGQDSFILFSSDGSMEDIAVDSLSIRFGNVFTEDYLFWVHAASVNSVTLNNFRLNVPKWNGDTPPINGVFQNPGRIAIRNGSVFVPSIADFGSLDSYISFDGTLAAKDQAPLSRVGSGFMVGAFSNTGASDGKRLQANILDSSRLNAANLPQMRFFNPNGQVGSIATNGSATAYNQSSDERLKESFSPLAAGDIIDQLNVYTYTWKIDGKPGVGVKAQEAYTAFPDAITPGEGKPGDDGFTPWQVDYSKFVPLLLSEVKALRSRVTSLEGGEV